MSLIFPVRQVGMIHQAKSVCEHRGRDIEKGPGNPRLPSNKDITLPSSPLSRRWRNSLFLWNCLQRSVWVDLPINTSKPVWGFKWKGFEPKRTFFPPPDASVSPMFILPGALHASIKTIWQFDTLFSLLTNPHKGSWEFWKGRADVPQGFNSAVWVFGMRCTLYKLLQRCFPWWCSTATLTQSPTGSCVVTRVHTCTVLPEQMDCSCCF